ncbi:MAG: hypothetical protein HYX32_14625 [Actinobacteria bacterium]|nr:hypothetical protein [Actinomycetota bacterium]
MAPVSVLDEPRSAARLESLAVDGPAYTAAVTDYRRAIDSYRAATDAAPRADSGIASAIAQQQAASDRFNARVVEIGELLAARARLEGERASAARRRDKGARQLDAVRNGLREMVVNEYVAGGFGGAPEEVFDLANANQFGSRVVLLSVVRRDRMVELQSVKDYRDQNEQLAAERQSEIDEVIRRISAAESARDQAVRDRDAALGDEQRARDEKAAAEQEVAARQRDVDDRRAAIADARLRATVPETGLPFVVLNAYVLAAERMAVERPDCRIRWAALAGIGRTESNHGTFGGSRVDQDGNETIPIYGIPLDGTNGTANIGDTDGGAIDNDPTTDRAAGPMQFIPSTWKTLGRDGNRDGKADPQNYYDATLAAAGLLCRAGDLSNDEGMRRAFRGYNNDSNYVETVLERTRDYDRFVFPPADAATDPATDVPGLSAPGG